MLICPVCRKKYGQNILVCPNCKQELKPPSSIKLMSDHPEKTSDRARKVHAPPKSSVAQSDEKFVELHRCGAKAAKKIAQLLEKEGVACLLARDESFKFHYQIDNPNLSSEEEGVLLTVPVSQLEKARALLDWESQKDNVYQDQEDFLREGEDGTTVCPACETEIPAHETTCPECGLELGLEGEESQEEEYYCSTCGEPCEPDDAVCTSCGAHFDH